MTEKDDEIIYRESRIHLFESRPGVIKCDWAPRNVAPDQKRQAVGTVKTADFENEAAAREFLIRRARHRIDQEQARDK